MSPRTFALMMLIFLVSPMALANEMEPTSTIKSSRGRAFNPDIGINTLLLYQNSGRGNDAASDPQNGFGLQEAEIQFTSDVDTYSRFTAIFAVRPELDTSGPAPVTEYHFEPEEVFAESLSLPFVTLKAGKFKTAFGRHNLLHTHAYPFIDAPLAHQELLGEEGHNDTGLSASVMMPLGWFSEITLQGLSGKSDLFEPSSPNSVSILIHWTNLWELSEATTLQWGLSGVQGKNTFDKPTQVWGSDVTLKWRPTVLGTTRSVVWSAEFISRELERVSTKQRAQGYVSYLQYQWAQKWWVQGRGEYLHLKDTDPLEDDLAVLQKQSFLVGFVPSEFSSVRLQYDHLRDELPDPEHKVSLQLNFSIGAHPAHLY